MASENHSNDDQAGRIKAMQLGQLAAVPYGLRAFMQLGVPKIFMDAGPGTNLTAEEISRSIPGKNGKPVDLENLVIILRFMVVHDVLTEEVTTSAKDPNSVERRYGATSVVKCLTDNEDGVSLAPFLCMQTDTVLEACLHFLHEPILDSTMVPYVLAHGKTCYDYAATDTRFNEVHTKAMVDHTHVLVKLLLNHEHYRGFDGLTSIVDVGGGLGASLAMILERYPNLKGINFDLPEVVASGIQAPRLEHVGGDFLESVPSGDAVWMKWVLHNWSDEKCITILKNIEKALPPNGKIISVESILPEVTDFSDTTKLNLGTSVMMMAFNCGGRERTLNEFRKLAAQAGFKSVEIVATLDNLSVLEFYKT